MGQLKRVVVLDQHDLLEDGLVGLGSDLAKGSRVPRFEHALDLLDELVHRVERSPVLERLDGVEKTQVEDVGVGAVEEPDVPTVGSTGGHDVRVIDVVSGSIVPLNPDLSVSTRPQATDGLMARNTSFSIFSLCTTAVVLFTSTILVSIVRAARCLLLLWAATCLVNGKMLIFPSKFWLLAVSLRGRTTAARNITFLMYGLCWTLLTGASSPSRR